MARRQEKQIETFNRAEPLSGCPQWPTSTSLAPETLRRLDRLMRHLIDEGRRPRRDEVLSLLILNPDPPGVEEMNEAIRRYRATTATHGRRMLMATLPAPVSLRLDSLVTELRRIEPRTFRRDVIGMLVWQRSFSPASLGDLKRYSDYCASDIEFDAKPDGDRVKVRRPLAGPRSMPA